MSPRNRNEYPRRPRANPSAAPLVAGLVIGFTALAAVNKYTKEETNAVLNAFPIKEYEPSQKKTFKGTVKISEDDLPKPNVEQNATQPLDIADYPTLWCNEGKKPPVKIYQIHDDLKQASEYRDCTTFPYPNAIIPIEINTEFDIDIEYEQSRPLLVYFPQKESMNDINKSTICQ